MDAAKMTRSALVGLTMAFGCVAPISARPLAPELGNLEGPWRLQIDPHGVGGREGWQLPGLDDSGWRTVIAPSYWEQQGITDPRPGKGPKKVDGLPYTDYDGIAWYRKHFELPADWRGEELMLKLGRVDDWDTVWLNGVPIGRLQPGSVKVPSQVIRTYSVPVDAARFDGPNVLAVRVEDGGGPGGLTGPRISLLPSSAMENMPMYSTPDAALADRFRNPPSENRILPIWHHAAQRGDADGVVQELLGQGFGGLATNMPFDKATYLRNPEHWANLKAILEVGKRAGLTFWLYDELGYPSGTAGGLTMEGHPEWQCEALLVADADTTGQVVELQSPPGRLVLAAAYPMQGTDLDLSRTLDLSSRAADGKLQWTPPAGDWHVVLITRDYIHEGAHVSVALADKGRRYINLLMAEPTERFCEITHKAYAEHLGEDLARYFVATFTDEPSLQTLWFREMPYRPLPWSPDFPDEFKARRGYALEPLLPLLAAGTGAAATKVRYDYWRTVGELVAENFFGVIGNVCAAHGLKSGGHLLLEEPLAYHVPLYGDLFRCIRRLSAPSIDCLTSIPGHVPWRIARLLSSAAELNGDRETMCEQSDHVQRYRPAGDRRPVVQVSLDQIRGSINRLLLGGIHVVTSYYNFGPFSAAELRDLNRFVGRCSTMLKGGHQVADIAVLYPSDSLCAAYIPSRHWANDAPKARAVERVYNSVSDALFRACRDFTYVDARTLAEARLAPGRLLHRELEWRVVVLPKTDTLPIAAWHGLRDFWRGGGIVVAAGALPANSETEFPSADVRALARELFPVAREVGLQRSAQGGVALYLPAGQEFLLPTFLDRLLEADVRADGGPTPVRATHRRVGDNDVYMLANDSAEPWAGSVALAGQGPGVFWDPATGDSSPIAGEEPVALALGPYAAVLVTFDSSAPRQHLADGLGRDAIQLTPLPDVTPDWAKGQFVDAELVADDVHTTPERPAWTFTGTLTKADTDTFLFAVFPFAPLDVAGADGLEIRMWAPDGQGSSAQCFVMLGDEAGHTWATSLDVRLCDVRELRRLVPFGQLKPAGWAKQPEGSVDFSRVTRVVIGWGGYFGKDGERLEYTAALPALFSIGAPR